MNYMFSTRSERIVVIENIRKPGIYFPPDWETRRSRQRQSKFVFLWVSHFHNIVVVITWLLQHNPSDRPTALELSQSSLLPPRMEDEYFKSALKMMGESSVQWYSVLD